MMSPIYNLTSPASNPFTPVYGPSYLTHTTTAPTYVPVKLSANAKVFHEMVRALDAAASYAHHDSSPKPPPAHSYGDKSNARWSLMKDQNGYPLIDLANGLKYWTKDLEHEAICICETERTFKHLVKVMNSKASGDSYGDFIKIYREVSTAKDQLTERVKVFTCNAKCLEDNLIIRSEVHYCHVSHAEQAIKAAMDLKTRLLQTDGWACDQMISAMGIAKDKVCKEEKAEALAKKVAEQEASDAEELQEAYGAEGTDPKSSDDDGEWDDLEAMLTAAMAEEDEEMVEAPSAVSAVVDAVEVAPVTYDQLDPASQAAFDDELLAMAGEEDDYVDPVELSNTDCNFGFSVFDSPPVIEASLLKVDLNFEAHGHSGFHAGSGTKSPILSSRKPKMMRDAPKKFDHDAATLLKAAQDEVGAHVDDACTKNKVQAEMILNFCIGHLDDIPNFVDDHEALSKAAQTEFRAFLKAGDRVPDGNAGSQAKRDYFHHLKPNDLKRHRARKDVPDPEHSLEKKVKIAAQEPKAARIIASISTFRKRAEEAHKNHAARKNYAAVQARHNVFPSEESLKFLAHKPQVSSPLATEPVLTIMDDIGSNHDAHEQPRLDSPSVPRAIKPLKRNRGDGKALVNQVKAFFASADDIPLKEQSKLEPLPAVRKRPHIDDCTPVKKIKITGSTTELVCTLMDDIILNHDVSLNHITTSTHPSRSSDTITPTHKRNRKHKAKTDLWSGIIKASGVNLADKEKLKVKEKVKQVKATKKLHKMFGEGALGEAKVVSGLGGLGGSSGRHVGHRKGIGMNIGAIRKVARV